LYYGNINISSEIDCDGYILENGEAGLSEKGAASLLGINRRGLLKIGKNGIPNKLKRFMESDEILNIFPVKVMAKDSPHVNRNINFYSVESIELLLRVYALGLVNGVLQKNQLHIGKRAVIVQHGLVKSTLSAIIRNSCGLKIEILKKLRKDFKSKYLEKELIFIKSVLSYKFPNINKNQHRSYIIQSFKNVYKNILTEEEHETIKLKKSYPLYKNIENTKIQNILSQYFLSLSSQILLNKPNFSFSMSKTNEYIDYVKNISKETKVKKLS
jgi:hypothetical protein